MNVWERNHIVDLQTDMRHQAKVMERLAKWERCDVVTCVVKHASEYRQKHPILDTEKKEK